MALIIAGCLAVSALTLIYPSTPTYDPWAWILWGREIAHLDLVTEGGPSWKPFPMFFTVPFSFFGQDLAPYLWLWVARAGGLFGCVMAYRVAYRLSGGRIYGVLAGVSAFAALLSSNKYVRDAALGNSEPILAAVVLWAFERHLDGRRDHALYLGVAAALLRPEAWPFLALYGLWLWFFEPRLRMRLVAFAVFVPACWILPEWWGAGDPLRAGSRANAPNPGSAAFAAHPALELFKRFAESTVAPVEAGTLVAVGVAAVAWWRRRAQGAGARARRARVLVVRARGRDDRGRLRGQPALPDGHHRRRLCPRRRGRGAGAPGHGEARRALVRRPQCARRGDHGRRRVCRRGSRSPRRRSWRRPTTPAACRAASSTRRSSGTT